MRKHLRPLALFTCITAAAAFGGQLAFAESGSPAGQPEARSGQQLKHKGHRGGERFFKKMARELDLSDQQKISGKALFEKSRAEQRPLMEAMMAEKRQLRTLVHSGSTDEYDIRAQAAKVATLEADLAVQRAEQAKQFLALLTPDQATKLKEIQARQKDRKGGKHRGHSRGVENCMDRAGK